LRTCPNLSAAVYRHLGKPEAYVRIRVEPLQQEQMVLEYVRSHGKITRWENGEIV